MKIEEFKPRRKPWVTCALCFMTFRQSKEERVCKGCQERHYAPIPGIADRLQREEGE